MTSDRIDLRKLLDIVLGATAARVVQRGRPASRRSETADRREAWRTDVNGAREAATDGAFRHRAMDNFAPRASRPGVVAERDITAGPGLRSGGPGAHRLGAHRTVVREPDPDLAIGWGGEDSFVARLGLIAQPPTEIVQGRRVVRIPARLAAETSFRNVREPCVWTAAHTVDQIAFDLPRVAVAEWAENHRLGRDFIPDAVSGTSVLDPVIEAFGLSLLPMLTGEAQPAQFFVDHVLEGVCAYLHRAFAGGRSISRGGLASWQERRAKEMMDAHTEDDLSLAELAAACGISVAHFSRAFRRSCGTTPRRWLTSRRLEKARDLLETTDMPLAVVANACGFTDQAHFTNVFTKHLGSPPGALRRIWRSRVEIPGTASPTTERTPATAT